MDTVTINRAPVLTLWAAVVAERLGFDREEALTLGKAVAGLTAQSTGQQLGILTPSPVEVLRKREEAAGKAGVFRDAPPAVRPAMRLADARGCVRRAARAYGSKLTLLLWPKCV
jgi:hypothetical protein